MSQKEIRLRWPMLRTFAFRFGVRAEFVPRFQCEPGAPGFVPVREHRRVSGCFKLHAAAGIHQHQNHIARRERFVDFLQHAAVELRGGLVHARRIDKHDLRRGMNFLARFHFQHADDAVARGLRFGRDDGDLFAGQGVHQRAFAGIRPAQNGNKS